MEKLCCQSHRLRFLTQPCHTLTGLFCFFTSRILKVMKLLEAKKVFFVGIGGIGISAIARMFLAQGKKVAGSDLSESEVTAELVKHGARISIGQGIELIPPDTDLIVYTVAIEEYDPELVKKIKALNIPSLSYPEALHEISKDKYTIAVAGTHGKTTTTAMIARILIDAGLDPTVIVGSFLVGHNSNFIAGKGQYFVVEACEYKRSFLKLEPTIGVILNVDDDHLDYYDDMLGVQRGFTEFAGRIKSGGHLVINTSERISTSIAKAVRVPVTPYMKFFDKDLKLSFPGGHVRKNAAAALAVAHILGIDLDKAKKSLANFRGTWRRFEYKGTMKNGALLYDDYGHHPAEIEATVSAMRKAFSKKDITVVFQPHLFSRTKEHLVNFGKVLAKADRVILAPIYAAREKLDQSISSEKVLSEIQKYNSDVLCLETFSDIADELIKSASEKDIIITMGAGDIYKVGELLLA